MVFQIYWVYNTYKTGERNFKTTVLNALYKSIDEYPLSVVKLPYGLRSKNPYLPLSDVIHQTITATSKDSNGKVFSLFDKNHRPIKIKKTADIYIGNSLSILPISSQNLPAVQQLVAQLMITSKDKTIRLNVLDTLFAKELKNQGITLPFKLSVLKDNQKPGNGQIVSTIPFAGDNSMVAVEITNTFQYLVGQNIGPALVSLLLILLSAGSLVYMGMIINRQMQVDNLKTDFINNITHELRTPIAILRSSNESLLKFGDLKDTGKTIRHLNINLDILDKLDKNVDRILDISRYEHGIKSLNYELVQIDQLIENVIGRFSIRDEVNIGYQSTLHNKLISTDVYIIDTVISNLVDNAIKYSNPPVDIQIISSPFDGNGWQLQVIDNGIGISSAHLPYIFDKFYRVGSGNLHDVKGYGLGLSYVKQLIASLHGDISAKSKLGVGTEFTIKFPGYE